MVAFSAHVDDKVVQLTKEAGFDLCLPQLKVQEIDEILVPKLVLRRLEAAKKRKIYNDFRSGFFDEEDMFENIQEDNKSGHISEEEESVSSG